MRKHICLLVILSLFTVTNAFCGPFGIDFGMSFEQVRKISKTTPEKIGDDIYMITPPNTHELFETYSIRIHPTYGVYFIKAISKDISTNRQGTTLINQFNGLVSSIEKTYSKYRKIDSLVQGSNWGDQSDYMYALSRDERTLVALWERDAGSKLPPEILMIIVAAEGKNTSTGYLIIEYYSINYEKIEEEQSSVF